MRVLQAALLDEIVRRIVAALQPETIYLYGSHAYGQPHEDSDVDLLVVLPEATRSGHDDAVEVYRALRGLCVPAEVQVVTRREFERRAQWLSSVERVAKEKGKILYASSEGMVKELHTTAEDGADVRPRRAIALDSQVVQPGIGQKPCPSHTVVCLSSCRILPISRTLYFLSHVPGSCSLRRIGAQQALSYLRPRPVGATSVATQAVSRG